MLVDKNQILKRITKKKLSKQINWIKIEKIFFFVKNQFKPNSLSQLIRDLALIKKNIAYVNKNEITQTNNTFNKKKNQIWIIHSLEMTTTPTDGTGNFL